MWTLKVGDVVLHRKDSIRNNDTISWDWTWQDFLRLSLIQVEYFIVRSWNLAVYY